MPLTDLSDSDLDFIVREFDGDRERAERYCRKIAAQGGSLAGAYLKAAIALTTPVETHSGVH